MIFPQIDILLYILISCFSIHFNGMYGVMIYSVIKFHFLSPFQLLLSLHPAQNIKNMHSYGVSKVISNIQNLPFALLLCWIFDVDFAGTKLAALSCISAF